jgi:hypothetical protein
MLKYVGKGDLNAVNIRIYGDGYSNEILIDVTKAPFMLDFGQGNKLFYPKNIDIANISGSPQPSDITFTAGLLQVVFDSAPPLADFDQSPDPHPTPHVSFTVNFIYGMQITSKDAPHQGS